MKKNILFLCTGNSCRSQMAEGWGKLLKGDEFNFYSAGTKKHGLNTKAVLVMKEMGVDISNHTSNVIEEVSNIEMDYVFTVCSDAHEHCPLFPTGKVIHIGFDDPPRLTSELKETEEILCVYRRVRDEIREFVINIDKHIEDQG